MISWLKTFPARARRQKIKYTAYGVAVVSFATFVYAVFGSDATFRSEGKWFLFCSIIALFIPYLKEWRYGEFVMKLDHLDEKVDTVTNKIVKSDIAMAMMRAYSGLPLEIQTAIAAKVREPFRGVLEGKLEQEAQERQLQLLLYGDCAKQLAEMPKEDASKLRAALTTAHLEGMGITISELKEKLSQLGFYNGGKDTEYNNQLENAILAFQKRYNAGPVDGVCGAITYDMIQKESQEASGDRNRKRALD